jgi:hypothetical protein
VDRTTGKVLTHSAIFHNDSSYRLRSVSYNRSEIGLLSDASLRMMIRSNGRHASQCLVGKVMTTGFMSRLCMPLLLLYEIRKHEIYYSY